MHTGRLPSLVCGGVLKFKFAMGLTSDDYRLETAILETAMLVTLQASHRARWPEPTAARLDLDGLESLTQGRRIACDTPPRSTTYRSLPIYASVAR